ncbi:MAG: ATP-binding protein, partial [Algicola sp.]|nr:ATP-binding protein [Algicola sp.]
SKLVNDVPQTQLNDALQLFKNFPFQHTVTTDSIREFWKLLIYLVKKRENDLRDFESKEENQDKTVRQVKKEFEESNPIILEKIGELWNKILNKAGLEFDVENANNPVQLNDNLKAYIKLTSNNQRINYGQLSTGIRNFIFRVGHIYSLYFNRDIEKGFLLLDEPENSLFPDFLYDLVENYFSLTKNTQLIIATHSPIIAAQFEPFERIILDFDDEGNVYSRKGVTPIGDDPNDLLIKDFGIRSLLGKEGMKKWERYLELKTLIGKEKDSKLKEALISEFMEIGNSYNFGE